MAARDPGIGLAKANTLAWGRFPNRPAVPKGLPVFAVMTLPEQPVKARHLHWL